MFEAPVRELRIQRVGPRFAQYARRLKHGHYGDDNFSKSSEEDKSFDNEFDIDANIEYLKSLDPKEWKQQDHYAVLGLKHLRFNATDDHIRRAYRKMVLKHHPDKRKAKGEEVHTEDDYFTCITKAYETLGNSKNRRAYDSVDPEFDDSLPTTSQIEKDFFKIFDKYFKLNARWSEKRNVPEIGDDNSTREHVEHFYNFWYNFESWREYSYLDEEDKEKGQDRDERRWIEKQNKAIRIKRKKEEMSRIRALVDLAYNNDPRIIRFKNEEKQRKLAAKRAKMDAVQAQKAEEERILREAQLAKEKAEQAEQKRIEQIRIENEKQKKALKKERKILRDMAKESNYYSTSDKEKLRNMEGVEKICEMLKLLELQSFNKELEKGGRETFLKVLKETEEKLEKEKQEMLAKSTGGATSEGASVKVVDKNAMWSSENMQLLIKAVNLFPAGTVQRWEVIATYMNQHSTNMSGKRFQARDILNKAKDLQSGNFAQSALKSQANEAAFSSFEKTKKELKKIDKADITVNSDSPATPNANKSNQKQNGEVKQNGIDSSGTKTPAKASTGASPSTPAQDTGRAWTKEEQALLEQAIKTYPVSTPDRWDRIAECIPNRTKKDCLRRVKELVDRVNAKKEAQQAVK